MDDYVPPSNLPSLVIWQQWHDPLWAKYRALNAAIDAAYEADPTDAALYLYLKSLELQEKYANTPRPPAASGLRLSPIDEAAPPALQSEERQRKQEQKGEP